MSMPAERLHSSLTLDELLADLADAPALPVLGIASDSRQVQDGFVFLAFAGLAGHGLDYAQQAIEQGAIAIAYDSSTAAAPTGLAIPAIPVAGLAEHIGLVCNRWFESPSEALKVVGVTGTNGKTTVAWLIARCLLQLGRRSGYVGTLGTGVEQLHSVDGMTTPAAVDLHGRLANFVAGGADYAAIEVSSHALSQGRVDGVQFDAALFTNLTRDHLDYHADMQDYFDTKASLFVKYQPRHRIINLDSEFGTELATRCGNDVVTVSTNFDRVANGRPYLFVRSVVATPRGSDVTFISSWGDGRLSLPLPGDFNVANAALVLAYLLVSGTELADACAALEAVTAPPGRMQRVDDSSVYVDYAHTPDALESVLRALRPHTRGSLWCVFGCGGDRDSGKRPQMGRIAARYADNVVVTSDNPRSEDPAAIINDIVDGIDSDVTVIEDRAAAIEWAIGSAAPNDVVLIAGKGHENYQEVDGRRIVFSDSAVARRSLYTTGAAS